MTCQGDGIRTTLAVAQGGTIQVEVGANDTTIDVKDGNPMHSLTYKVEPGKTVTIPVPPVPGGTVLTISVGRGPRARTVLVEVIAPFR